MLHPFLAMRCPLLPMLRPFVARHHPFLATPCPLFPMPRPLVAALYPFLARHHPFLAMPRPFVAALYPFLARHHPFLPMRRPFLAMFHAFAATPREGEDASHEESPSHHVLLGVLFIVLTTPRQSLGRAVPSRGVGSECVGSSWERGTTRPAYVGMPREPLEMPDEDGAMRSTQSRRSRSSRL
jgi:hypothetical protein